MESLAPDVPKTLIPVHGRPFADYQLTWLAGQGVKHVVYAIGHMGGAIRDFVGDGSHWGLDVRFVDEGTRLLGTAGALRLAVHDEHMNEGFFVLYGDSYLNIELPAVWRAADSGRAPLMTVFANHGRWDSSNAVVTDGRVSLYEKGRADGAEIDMDFIDYGLSVLTRDIVIEHVSVGEVTDLADVFHRLSRGGVLRAFEAQHRFYEIGSPEGLADLEAHLVTQGHDGND